MSGCHLPVAFIALIILNHLKIELASGCQLPIHYNVGSGIWLLFEGGGGGSFLPGIIYPPKSNWHLAASYKYPVHWR